MLQGALKTIVYPIKLLEYQNSSHSETFVINKNVISYCKENLCVVVSFGNYAFIYPNYTSCSTNKSKLHASLCTNTMVLQYCPTDYLFEEAEQLKLLYDYLERY